MRGERGGEVHWIAAGKWPGAVLTWDVAAAMMIEQIPARLVVLRRQRWTGCKGGARRVLCGSLAEKKGVWGGNIGLGRDRCLLKEGGGVEQWGCSSAWSMGEGAPTDRVHGRSAEGGDDHNARAAEPSCSRAAWQHGTGEAEGEWGV
jgi:hypothetical protein